MGHNMNILLIIAFGAFGTAIILVIMAFFYLVRGYEDQGKNMLLGFVVCLIGGIASCYMGVSDQKETDEINKAQAPFTACAIVTKTWHEQTGGGHHGGVALTVPGPIIGGGDDPIITRNVVAWRMDNGELGSTYTDEATYGAVNAGDRITIRHTKTGAVQTFTGQDVWIMEITKGCHPD